LDPHETQNEMARVNVWLAGDWYGVHQQQSAPCTGNRGGQCEKARVENGNRFLVGFVRQAIGFSIHPFSIP
jgi:hypothetical protein